MEEEKISEAPAAEPNAGKKAVRTIGLMAVIILLAKFMGLFRETLVANLYGQGMESDMINTATQIPLLFFDMVLGVAILSTFVPIFNKYLKRDRKAAAMHLPTILSPLWAPLPWRPRFCASSSRSLWSEL